MGSPMMPWLPVTGMPVALIGAFAAEEILPELGEDTPELFVEKQISETALSTAA